MIKESLTLRSSIPFSFIRKTLLKGSGIACLGMIGLLIGGVLSPISTLQTWGLGLFLLSLALITIGLLPYRHLSLLQLKPNQLSVVELDQVIFFSKNKKILTIPLESVAQIQYIHNAEFYGIAIWLKPHSTSPVIIHQCYQEVNSLRYHGRLIGADLFFPFFNQHAYDELMNWLKEEEEYDESLP